MTGRNTSLTAAVWKAIVTSITGGASMEDAAGAAGVSRYTLWEWQARGEGRHARGDPNGRFAKFAHDVQRARDEAVQVATSGLFAAGATDWRAYEAWLRNMYPRRFGRRMTVEIEELRRIARQAAEQAGLPPELEPEIMQRAHAIAASAWGSDDA